MTKRLRMLSTAATVLIALGLTGCGKDSADRDGGTWADGRSKAPATSAAAPTAAPNADDGRPKGRPTESPSTPPFTMPTKAAGAPSARKVVDAFKAAGLKVPNVRDRSTECGPDGGGIGCAQLLATDAVSVYVFPDEATATNQTAVWGTDAYRKGAVVLNYLGTRTTATERKRYDDVLAKLA
ncbi:hypothetical protein Q2K19_03080 [Micromonospora soli]|uniref:hypothetical protein n=1 Tax=Micromonospora sp. NBRC 110009 TaxID=3061627 RepID=UPI0026722CC4|nr:hypothetical protein [Micromonospora sp. NBRC 110009]WKT99505.1 hypothetical protein Q2K19_03080 [Micromonospora sp. NBRC 110009]